MQKVSQLLCRSFHWTSTELLENCYLYQACTACKGLQLHSLLHTLHACNTITLCHRLAMHAKDCSYIALSLCSMHFQKSMGRERNCTWSSHRKDFNHMLAAKIFHVYKFHLATNVRQSRRITKFGAVLGRAEESCCLLLNRSLALFENLIQC